MIGGTNRDIIFWDVRKLKHPLEVLDESHNEDVTAIRFHPNPSMFQRVMTCGVDSLLNFYDFAGKTSMKEEETLEGSYCSE